MLTPLGIGQSGLKAFAEHLIVISNNVSNLNTVGFKSSESQFAELFSQGGSRGVGVGLAQGAVNYRPGTPMETGRELDVMVDGRGYFVLKNREDGTLLYTKSGRFDYDKDGYLVSDADPKLRVMAYNASGELQEVKTASFLSSAPVATTEIAYKGGVSNLVSEVTTNVKVYDSAGALHTLKLSYKRAPAPPGGTSTWKLWDLQIKEGDTLITATPLRLRFEDNGFPDTVTARGLEFEYTPLGGITQRIKIPMSSFHASENTPGTTASSGLSDSDASANGRAIGVLASKTFDVNGNVKFTYSNGDSITPFKLALATFQTHHGLRQVGNGAFATDSGATVRTGTAGAEFGQLVLNTLEKGNVDLTVEFSNMITTQRGYQASSQIISTANGMLEELIKLAGNKA
jgi:flagellar hook protein FlgE